MSNLKIDIATYIGKERTALNDLDMDKIESACKILHWAISNKRTIYCFGNGGSGSTASHMANDFNKILKARCICLNDNIATVMAIANDISYSNIFYEQLIDRIKPGDVVIGISGSGKSFNVIKAIEYANGCGAITISLTGFDGGTLKYLTDVNLHAPIDNMQITEDVHLMFNHLIVSILSKFLS